MNFAIAEVDPGFMISGGALLVLAVGYVALAVFLGRRFGGRGLWGIWTAAIVLAAVVFTPHHRNYTPPLTAKLTEILATMLVFAIPTGAAVLALGRTLRRPRPAEIPVQVAIGMGAFFLAVPLGLAAFIALLIAAA